jgi:hypothetical protein
MGISFIPKCYIAIIKTNERIKLSSKESVMFVLSFNIILAVNHFFDALTAALREKLNKCFDQRNFL